MDNNTIADNFSLLSKLMEIHGDNSFKAKSYSSAAFTIEKLPIELSSLSAEKIFSIKGIGETIGQKIIEQIESGQLTILTDYLSKTPSGIMDMLGIKGIGPKKISTIWRELEIETLGELLYACNENRLTLYKGFGEKTQLNIKASIEFYLGTIGSYLYQQIETYALAIDEKLKAEFPEDLLLISGGIRRQLEIIEKIEWVTTITTDKLKTLLTSNDFEIVEETPALISFKGKENTTLLFHFCNKVNIYSQLFVTSCSEDFLMAWNKKTNWQKTISYSSEEEIFLLNGIPYIPPFQREKATIIDYAINNQGITLIEPTDIIGIIHSHSKWSDGANTIEEMAKAAIEKNLQYLVISDHSKSAFYASGLKEERVYAQQQQIDELNIRLAPFKIFKSIESDILNDGSLDYANNILDSFDIVIASIHSNLKMNEEKAMMRLMNAIQNPYTSILGHLTGRLLLSRNGYPVDHKTIIETCATHNVAIELNAHPRRLDMDWRWIDYAMKNNVLISINPDAHSINGYNDCRYGVLVAQKAGLTKEQNLSSYSLNDFEKFVVAQKEKRKKRIC